MAQSVNTGPVFCNVCLPASGWGVTWQGSRVEAVVDDKRVYVQNNVPGKHK